MGVRVTRTAKASWQGDLPSGGGRIGSDHPPADLNTTARVRLEQLDTGFTITRIELQTTGEVPGVDADTFAKLAQQAKDTCPVSRALAGTEITLEARLAGD